MAFSVAPSLPSPVYRPHRLVAQGSANASSPGKRGPRTGNGVKGGDTVRIVTALGRLSAPPWPRDRAPSPRELEGDTAKCMLCAKRLIMKDSRASVRPIPRVWVGFGTPGRSPGDHRRSSKLPSDQSPPPPVPPWVGPPPNKRLRGVVEALFRLRHTVLAGLSGEQLLLTFCPGRPSPVLAYWSIKHVCLSLR